MEQHAESLSRSRYVMDLARQHFAYDHGEVMVIGTWFRNDEQWRPCLALVRPDDLGKEGCEPCIVLVDRAFIWEPETGDAAQVAQSCYRFAKSLRLNYDDPKVLTRLAMLVGDHLGDLLAIPPLTLDRRPAAIASLTDPESGELITEIDVDDD